MAPPPNILDWDYTDAQWKRISDAIKRVRRDPLNDIERDALRIAAIDYILDSRKKGLKGHTRKAEREAWAKASELILELKDAIKRAANITNALGRTTQRRVFVVTEEIMAAVLGRPQPSPKTTKINVKGHWKEIVIPNVPRDAHTMTTDEVGVLLSQLKLQIDRFFYTWRFGPGPWLTYTGRLEARVVYMQQILWLWTHRFGGKLTRSVDSTHTRARIYGPLVDYISAVADPVMKEHAPKPSALRDVLERQKKFYAWLAGYERKWGRKIEPWAYDRAVAMREAPLLYGRRALT